MKIQPVFVEILPTFERIEAGQIWISHKHRTANLRCPCGCGELTVLTLHPSRWHVHFDGKTVSLMGPTGGSVWASSGCGCHYYIRKNEVVWLNSIDSNRHKDYANAERLRMISENPSGRTGMTWLDRTWHQISNILSRLWHRLM